MLAGVALQAQRFVNAKVHQAFGSWGVLSLVLNAVLRYLVACHL